MIYDFHAGTDNGNVATITDCESTDRTQNFDYDSLNRMKDGYTTGSGTMTTNWGETYTIDPWGNLTNIGLYPGKHNSETLNAAPASSKNQLPGYSYDAAGNMTSNGSTTYTYDAENRVTATSGYSYVYDANGRRVIKCGGTFPTCGSGTLYWRGTAGDPLAETDFTGAPTEEYVFFNGARIARRDGTGNTALFHFADHLGSTDVITSSTGGIQKLSVFYPYGGEIPVTGSSFANNYKFTGKERDSESGLDNFGARYDASSLGRFMTPDWSATPAAVPFANPADPQSLNLYSYVVNNPLNRTDPTGHNWFCTSGGDASCKHWEWHKGSAYTDANGNKFKSNYTGLLTAQANGTDKKTGATLYKLTLYDQNKAVATGTGFSGGMGQPAIKDGNYIIRLDIRDPNGPNTINPNSPLNNPPQYWGIQKMHNFDGWDVVGAYGPIRAHLNPASGKREDDAGDFFHGQTNGHGWTHGCLCYGTDTRFADYMWNNMPHAPLPAAIDVPTDQP